MRFVSSRFVRLLAIATAFALCGSFVLAQQTLGGITGEVTDASGGVIPNATVTVVDEQTSLTRTVKTNGAGVYSFVNLPIDSYTSPTRPTDTVCRRRSTSLCRQTALRQ